MESQKNEILINLEEMKELIASLFHMIYHQSNVWNGKTTFFTFPVCKPPTDLWTLQEIIVETDPTVIIETGTWYGGSALWLAVMLDCMYGWKGTEGKVISIDTRQSGEFKGYPRHARIKYLIGSSTDSSIVDQVKEMIQPEDRVMVILDSDHKQYHVQKELEIYSKLVSKGCYLVVEDTNLNGNPILLPSSFSSSGPGPNEAVKNFMETNKDFEVDFSREKYLLTFNPGGYLRRL